MSGDVHDAIDDDLTGPDRPSHMTPGERMIYATTFAFAWGTRYEEALKLGRINLKTLACVSASAAAAAVRVFRIAAAHLPQSDPARPYLDDMLAVR